MYKSVVVLYEGERVVGELELLYGGENGVVWGEKVLRISHYSPPSERCPPLAVLHTITSSSTTGNGISFKLEPTKSKSLSPDSPLFLLHSTCLRDNKTAVVSLGREELHLVAMQSKNFGGQCPCFWGFKVASGLYNSCLTMLNLRCLGIVFDLDETLIVANTMRSFEDRIEALLRKINSESDPQRASAMLAEVKRYQEDKIFLKQYAENDQVIDNGKVIKSQSEVFPALSDNHQPIVRPLIRLQDRNIILTRINPMIRDTSVLVRLRPAWEDLRSYLTARGRKRFEVYVCTMAERDYALEMWRLLDPDSNLINSKELLDRIVCVKSGLRKSLFNVFQDGNCHPKMALVIDDRLKVWDEKDQPRVHVVPAFAPYFSPQAEGNNSVPVLCVARNVACNVRGGFFKDFDEGLLQRISEVAYEDEIKQVPSAPDVSNYLISEDDPSAVNGNKDSLGFDGMADTEVERRLKEAMLASTSVPSQMTNSDPRIAPALQYPVPPAISQSTIQAPVVPFPAQHLPQVTSVLKASVIQLSPQDTSLQSSPAREEGEVPESELDPDTRRRLLILQHGQDTRDQVSSEPQFPMGTPLQVSVPPRVQPHGWFPVEEEMSPRQLNRALPPKEFPLNSESMHINKNRPPHPPFLPKIETSVPSDRVLFETQRLPKEVIPRDDRMRFSQSQPSFHPMPGEEVSLGRSSSSNRDLDLEPGHYDPYLETPAGALQDIAFKCGAKVEFKSGLLSSPELQFSVEVWFAGEKIGEGIGRTRREAQRQAAEESLMNLADKYLSRLKPDLSSTAGDGFRFPNASDNGFVDDMSPFGYQSYLKEDRVSHSFASEPSRVLDPRLEVLKKSVGSVASLRELCAIEGLGLAFQTQPQLSANPGKTEIYAQVEIDGQVFGKGIGSTWDDAKAQAAERALVALKSELVQFSHKRQGSPRSLQQGFSNKRLRPEYSRGMQRLPSSGRFPKNTSAMP
ncbi:PREDICTED: RNA polymerase II C-terminal domain phosphatase-like 1 [Nicotiana attenuata]|uniref:protein-serine/threonine phosphatase n=1 Tax=Nicotiana attenuata TaxID=49451 RepID=A0A1J6HXG0_NICAT|nr:PREDICTED: RNA polymerase II C-terminal domain phosphatase-like 1 [Nicotiana attenuata]XP_019254202.1 PREDICTED: RNA polymerase II C-terminal domain phosphatase-like 1 [Nicotiana attenuata]OIS97517.1 rna polymerase ii c-terminal domain phosphatase-like 1 [Nicotiana attenuata]